MEEKEISHEESLRLIHEMIGSAKSNYYESGLGALLWGFTNVICFTLAYIDAVSPNFNFPISPFFLIVITFGLQYYLDKKERKNKTATTYIDSFIGYAWLAFAISVFIITIGGAFAHIGYIVLPVLLLLFGIPTFITGCAYKFTPFIIGGVICWLLCLVSLFFKSNITFLLVAAGAFFAWVVPGFILRSRFYKKKKSHVI